MITTDGRTSASARARMQQPRWSRLFIANSRTRAVRPVAHPLPPAPCAVPPHRTGWWATPPRRTWRRHPRRPRGGSPHATRAAPPRHPRPRAAGRPAWRTPHARTRAVSRLSLTPGLAPRGPNHQTRRRRCTPPDQERAAAAARAMTVPSAGRADVRPPAQTGELSRARAHPKARPRGGRGRALRARARSGQT